MVELVDSVDLGSTAKACRFESCCPHHNRTSVLIQWVSKRVSGFYLQKPLFTRVFLYHLTKTGSAVTEKWSPRSLFAFLRRNLFMKAPEGVHSHKRNNEKARQVFEWEDIALSDPINKCAYR